jgi:hypothetical protein
VEAVGHRCDQILSLCDQFYRYSVCTSVEELLDLCHFCSVYHHMLHQSGGAMLVCLLVLHTLRVLSQTVDSDSEHYIEQLLIEMLGWDKFLGYRLLKIGPICLSMVVSCFKSSFVNELHIRQKSSNSHHMQQYVHSSN